MKEHWGAAKTSVETIARYSELADRGGDAGAAAQAWTEADFDDETTARWLDARCFDARAARALADLSVTPSRRPSVRAMAAAPTTSTRSPTRSPTVTCRLARAPRGRGRSMTEGSREPQPQPHPNTWPCVDCRHVWFAGERQRAYVRARDEACEGDEVICVLCQRVCERTRPERRPA